MQFLKEKGEVELTSHRPSHERHPKAQSLEPKFSVDRLQLFPGFEANGLSGRNGNFGAGARIASDAGLARAYVEDAKAPQLNAIALGERFFHALENSFDGELGFGLGDAGFIDDFVNDIQLDHEGLPLAVCGEGTKCLMLREIWEIVNGRECRVG
jgi:hypothetical protein